MGTNVYLDCYETIVSDFVFCLHTAVIRNFEYQANLLVVIENSVHVLDPDSINRPVKDHPLSV